MDVCRALKALHEQMLERKGQDLQAKRVMRLFDFAEWKVRPCRQ